MRATLERSLEFQLALGSTPRLRALAGGASAHGLPGRAYTMVSPSSRTDFSQPTDVNAEDMVGSGPTNGPRGSSKRRHMPGGT